jgi:hypothetical protein
MINGIQNRQGSKFTVSYPDFPGFVVIPRTFKLYQEAGKQDLIDLEKAKIPAVVLGKAIYENKITLKEITELSC